MAGSVLVFISMCFKSSTTRGNLVMRLLNMIGSIIFIVYGIMLSAFSTILLNVVMVIVHLYYMIKLLRDMRLNKNNVEGV